MLPSIRDASKRLMKAALPRGVIEELKLPVVHRRIMARARGTVLGGPFAGMRYAPPSDVVAFHSKVLGTYERQIAPLLGPVLAGSFRTFVNVGAGEGYYAVGVARRSPGAAVVAFERDSHVRALLAAAVEANGVAGRVAVRGECSPELLAGVLEESVAPVFLMVDVEGYESTLLDPDRVPGLGRTAILVELHPWLADGLESTLRARFERTHRIVSVKDLPRTREDFPLALPPWLWPIARRSMAESRPVLNQEWWCLSPRSGTQAPEEGA